MRLPVGPLAAGAIVLALGVAGFVRGAVPQAGPAAAAGQIAVSGASIVASTASSTTASFTVYNTTARADRLVQVACGAGGSVIIHSNPVIPARGSRVVDIVVSQLFGPLAAGQTVDLQLDFATAPSLGVTTQVVPQARQGQSPLPRQGQSPQPSSGAPS